MVGVGLGVNVGVGDGVAVTVGGGVGVAVLTTKLLFDEPLQPAIIIRPTSSALSRTRADFTTTANVIAASRLHDCRGNTRRCLYRSPSACLMAYKHRMTSWRLPSYLRQSEPCRWVTP